MGKTPSKPEDYRRKQLEEAKKMIEKKGVEGAQIVMKEKLGEWKNVKIKFGVTGLCGVGKSSFVNSIRGVDGDVDNLAKTGVITTTTESASYTHPNNSNITFEDLPGLDSSGRPNLEVYCKEFKLEMYDMFLILTSERFRHLDLVLARKVKSIGKPFFLIRTKIDLDVTYEKRNKDGFDGEKMIEEIRNDCYKNAEQFLIDHDEVFLISNHHPEKWDFMRLVVAIFDKLLDLKKEAFALSLSLRHSCKEIVEKKVEVLRGRLWKDQLVWLTTLSGNLALQLLRNTSTPEDSDGENWEIFQKAVGCGPIPFAIGVLGPKLKFYMSKLGLPEEDSEQFSEMRPELQTKMRNYYSSENTAFFKSDDADAADRISFPIKMVEKSLNLLLDELQQLSFDILDDAVIQTNNLPTV